MAALTSLILAGLVAGETGLSAYSSYKSAKGAKKMGAYEGQMYDTAAQDAIARGEEAANRTATQARVLTGAQRAALAASGVDIGSGSAADVQASDQRVAQINEQQFRLNAAREAFGFTEQGRLARLGAKNQAQGYTNQMYSTLLGGAAQMYSIYRSAGLNRVPRAQTTTSSGGDGTGFTGEWHP